MVVKDTGELGRIDRSALHSGVGLPLIMLMLLLLLLLLLVAAWGVRLGLGTALRAL
jgi:hypothetical protein